MIRSFALTYAAVMLRLYLPLFLAGLRMDFEISYQIISWLCWVPNLIFVEYFLIRRGTMAASPQSQPTG